MENDSQLDPMTPQIDPMAQPVGDPAVETPMEPMPEPYIDVPVEPMADPDINSPMEPMAEPAGDPELSPEEKPRSKALDIADGLLMIIFAFALYAEIYSVFLYAWH